jgi:hypothetical protein
VRLGIVIGHVVLSKAIPALKGTSLLLVDPVTAANLAARNSRGGGRTLVVADRQLSPAVGQMIGVVEGREAASPYPEPAPVDAYCALIVNDYTFEPPDATERTSAEGRG